MRPVFRVGYDVEFEAAIEQARKRTAVLPDVYYGQMQGVARTQAYSVAGLTALAQVKGALDSLQSAIREGKSFEDWQLSVAAGKNQIDLPRHRLDNIFRTNIQTSYNRGIWESQKEHLDARPFLMYDAINDSRTRPAHRAMDNYIADAKDPIWQVWYPPNGYRCRCRAIALSPSEAQTRGLGTQKRPGVQPDPGWDYDIREAPLAGVKRAVKDALGSAPPKLAQAAQKVAAPGDAYDIGEWRPIPGTQKGSNPGGMYVAPDGTKWYVKLPHHADHARSEVAAGVIHKALGINVPETMLIVRGEKIGIASRWVEGMQRITPEVMAAQHAEDLAKIYQASIITKNWDAVGQNYDNILRGPDGKLWMIDSGASFRFRAQGASKPFGKDIADRLSLIDSGVNAQSGALFGGLAKKDPWWEWHGQRALNKLDADATRRAFVGTGLSLKDSAELADAVLWRQNALRDLYELDSKRLYPGFGKHLAHFTKWKDRVTPTPKAALGADPKGWNSKGSWDATRQMQDEFKAYANTLAPSGYGKIRFMFRKWSGNSSSASGAVMKEWARDRFGAEINYHDSLIGAAARTAVQNEALASIRASGVSREKLYELLDAEYEYTQWQLRLSLKWGDRMTVRREVGAGERGGQIANDKKFRPNAVISTASTEGNYRSTYGFYLDGVSGFDVSKTYWEGDDILTYYTRENEFIVLGGREYDVRRYK